MEDDPHLRDRRELRSGRVQLEVRTRDRRHRVHGMDPFEAQLPERVHDQGIRGADRVDAAINARQRGQVEVVWVAVRDDEQIDRPQTVDVDRASWARDDTPLFERVGEDGVDEARGTSQFDQQRRVPEEYDAHEPTLGNATSDGRCHNPPILDRPRQRGSAVTSMITPSAMRDRIGSMGSVALGMAAPTGGSGGMSRSHRRPVRRVPVSGFAGFRFLAAVIVLAVRWYLRFGLSYRDVGAPERARDRG